MSRVLVLVLSLDAEPWSSIECEGQRRTWAADPPPSVSVLFYFGLRSGPTYWLSRVTAKALRIGRLDAARSRFIEEVGRWSAGRPVTQTDSRVQTRVPESYINTNAKLQAALRHVLVTDDFDFLLRTNTSSYVHLPTLNRFASSLVPGQDTRFYGGTLEEKSGITYASGAGVMMSRDVVAEVANDPAWEYDLIDDVALGRSADRLGIAPTAIPRIDIADPDEAVSPNLLRASYHVRCRGKASRSQDITIMHRVHACYAALERGESEPEGPTARNS